MRHRKSGRKLGRSKAQRRALFRVMVTDLLRHGAIRSTLAKCREAAPLAEKMVTHAKKGDLHHRRLAASFITDPAVLSKTFDEIGPNYEARDGGYTRIIKLGRRRGDDAEMAVLELVEYDSELSD